MDEIEGDPPKKETKRRIRNRRQQEPNWLDWAIDTPMAPGHALGNVLAGFVAAATESLLPGTLFSQAAKGEANKGRLAAPRDALLGQDIAQEPVVVDVYKNAFRLVDYTDELLLLLGDQGKLRDDFWSRIGAAKQTSAAPLLGGRR